MDGAIAGGHCGTAGGDGVGNIVSYLLCARLDGIGCICRERGVADRLEGMRSREGGCPVGRDEAHGGRGRCGDDGVCGLFAGWAKAAEGFGARAELIASVTPLRDTRL